MRRAVRYAVLLAVLGAVLGGWLYHQHARVISDYPLKTLSIEPERLSQQHVGELVAGRSITQRLDWRGLRDRSLDLFGDQPFCVALFFANYYDRNNTGTLVVGLELSKSAENWSKVGNERLNVADIRNYRYESVCFEGITLAQAMAQPARVRLTALDSPPGRSVTVYLADYADERLGAETLIHRVQVRADHRNEQIGAWVILAAVVGILLAVIAGLAHASRAGTSAPAIAEQRFSRYIDWLVAQPAPTRLTPPPAAQALQCWVVLAPEHSPEAAGLTDQDYPYWTATRSATQAATRPDLPADQVLVVVLHAGVRLKPHALSQLVKGFMDCPHWQLAYTDSERLDEAGQPIGAFFKPDWSPHLLAQPDYPGGLLAMRASALPDASAQSASAADWVALAMTAERAAVGHVAQPLVQIGPNAVPPSMGSLITPSPMPALDKVLVSIIIPLRDKVDYLRACIESISRNTRGVAFEIIVVDNGSVQPETAAYLDKLRAQDNGPVREVLRIDEPFNWSMVNNRGAAVARGDVLLFLNNDTDVSRLDWLARLAEMSLRPEVGCVGGLLLFPDQTIQHSGVVVGMNHWADHVFIGQPVDVDFAPLANAFVNPTITRNVLAVTGACLAVSRKLYEQLGGLDEDFLICGSDVVFCLEAYRSGRYNVLCAEARLLHHESKTRSREVPEIDFVMSAKTYEPWRTQAVDPFYNPNLGLFATHPQPAVRQKQ